MPEETVVVAPVVTPPAEKPWYDGAPAEDVGYFQNRGMDKMTAKDAALAAAKAHREAEKLIGGPADKMIRLPESTDAEGWRQVRLKMGVPQDEKGYDFSVVKHADGSALTDAEKATFGKKAYSLGLRPADALQFVSDSVKEADSGQTSSAVELAGRIAAEKTKLAQNWGANFEANMFVAKQTAAALGVSAEALEGLGNAIGLAATLEMFRTIGTKIGEDKFVMSHLPGDNHVMTKEAAVDRKKALMADQVWVKAYLEGDAQKKAEMTALNTLIVG
jgi:hypothetical protein